MRMNYAMALKGDSSATQDDLSEAVTTLEDTARIAWRVLGGAHPCTWDIEDELQEHRAPRFDKAARAINPAKGLVHYSGRLEKARRRGNARKIAKFGRKLQKYNKLAAAAVETS